MKSVPLTCYLDAFSGISGDMLVGALADAGASQEAISGAIASTEKKTGNVAHQAIQAIPTSSATRVATAHICHHTNTGL